eukprot:maker-scaffold2440_size15721-snap-gene-0.3 protein:Tk01422 transcript:maker-scaffold2440_size15721-snap-gene-0.3-mRNA-1 annotation:"k acetyltransferase 7"
MLMMSKFGVLGAASLLYLVNNAATAFIHQIKITNELYYEDYKDVKKKRFQNMKTNIDELWNSQGIEHLLANGFERASVIEITSSSHNLEVHTLIQFRDEFESEAYQGKFYTQMIEESFFGRYIISSNSTISGTSMDLLE